MKETQPDASLVDEQQQQPASDENRGRRPGDVDADAPSAGSGLLTHFDAGGRAHMVDVGAKAETERLARASGRIRMRAQTLALIASGGVGKGDVLGVARIAGIQAAKRTADLIPLCHPVALTRVTVDFEIVAADNSVICLTRAQTCGRTGVEMEALSACAAALLTVYDMCKAADRGMIIDDIRLLEKDGGKSGRWTAPPAQDQL